MKNLLAWVAVATLMIGCANEVVDQRENGGNGGGPAAGGGGSSSSSSGTGSTECVVQDPPTMTDWTCQGLEGIILEKPTLFGDDGGDGYLGPGEAATISMWMRDTSGLGFSAYPGVKFTASDPNVFVTPEFWFYAILPCTEQEAAVSIKVLPEVPLGTKVMIRAQVGMINQECPDGFVLEFPVTIQ